MLCIVRVLKDLNIISLIMCQQRAVKTLRKEQTNRIASSWKRFLSFFFTEKLLLIDHAA